MTTSQSNSSRTSSPERLLLVLQYGTAGTGTTVPLLPLLLLTATTVTVGTISHHPPDRDVVPGFQPVTFK